MYVDDSDLDKMTSERAEVVVMWELVFTAWNSSGRPSPWGDDAYKCAGASLGGECLCAVSARTSPYLVNPSTSDELINYSDT